VVVAEATGLNPLFRGILSRLRMRLHLNSVSARSGSSSNELVFTGALGGSNAGSNVKSAPQTRAGSDAINFG